MRARSYLFLPFALTILFSSCTESARQEITDVREPSGTRRQAPPKMNTQQRFGGGAAPAAEASSDSDPLAGITFHHDVPAGWEQVPQTQFRQVNLRMTDVPEAEAYFTLLPGGGGGVAANLNRWRAQMGQPELTPEAIEALPKKAMFGQPATFIQIDGPFSGMGSEPKEDYRLYGLILSHVDPESGREQALFLKMTGPRAVLAEQEGAFDLIAETLHAVAPGDTHSHGDEQAHSEHDGHDHGDAHSADDGHNHGDAHSDDDGHDHGAMASGSADNAPAEATTADSASGFQWTVPSGWEDREPSMMRQANLTISGQPDVEAYLTVLAGTGGGLEMNINRWRQQMGQPELTPAEIAALPKHDLLGGEASFVIIDGTFGGMSGTVNKEDYRMYGLVRVDETEAYFVKMTGPREVLAAQEENFLNFSASIRRGSAAAAPEAMPAPAAPPAAAPVAANEPASASEAGLQWTAPEGWQNGGERAMRLVTYEIGATECYITLLPGPAGGVEANINRWVVQMGQEALDEAALAALPRIALLGTDAPLVEVAGTFTTMSGEQNDGYKLLGTVAQTGDQTIFVKMTGPETEVNAQKENFVAFCGSLR